MCLQQTEDDFITNDESDENDVCDDNSVSANDVCQEGTIPQTGNHIILWVSLSAQKAMLNDLLEHCLFH